MIILESWEVSLSKISIVAHQAERAFRKERMSMEKSLNTQSSYHSQGDLHLFPYNQSTKKW